MKVYLLLRIFMTTPLLAGETLYNGIVLPDVWPPLRDIEALRRGELTKLAGRKGQPMRLEFAVQNGRLFSFWIQ